MHNLKTLALCTTFVISSSFALDCAPLRCEVIVDAGSSGTRLQVFRLNPKTFAKDRHIDLLYSSKINLPIEQLNPKNIDNQLHQLFDYSNAKPLPLYIYATGGVRSLSLAKQKEVFNLLNAWVSKQKKLQLKDMRTVKGSEEGMFTWLSTMFNLQNKNPKFNVYTAGIVEIGGSSSQISFPVVKMENKKNVYKINWFGQDIYLWSISLKHFGMSYAYQAIQNNPNCFSHNYPLVDNAIGKGDFNKCVQDLEKHFRPALDQGQFISHKNITNWYGFGVLAFMGQSPLYDFKNGHYQLSQFEKVADSNVCQKEWSILNKQFAKVKLLERTCVSSAYAYWLSTQALHLPVSTNIIYDEANNNNSWTKGSVIIRHMPSSYRTD